MKWLKKIFANWGLADTILWLLVLSIALLIIVFASSCTSSKAVTKTVVDSTSLTEKSDSIRLLKSERDRFEELYNELIYSGVIFDTLKVTDTVNHFNTVYITKDGEIKATGNIKSASVSKSIIQSIIASKDKTIDSLRNLTSKDSVNTHRESLVKKVKKSVFPWWLFLAVSLASFFGGVYVSKRYSWLFKWL